MKEKVPRNFKPPDMDLYDGTTDPSHHLSNFRSRMYLVDASDAIRCKAFPTTLTKSAMKWFDNLPPGSISSFEDLTKKFLTRFSIQKDKAKHAPSLLGIKQGNQETLREYMERFNKACLDIQHLPTEAAIMGLANGLKEGPFSQSLSKRYPTSLYEVQERAEKYINMEETSRLRDSSRKESTYSLRDRDREQKKKEESSLDKPRKYHSYTPLRVSLVDVYREVCHTEKIPPPKPLKHKRAGRDRSEYCEYHRLYGHSTNDCHDLKNVIEKLAREGKLDRYIAEKGEETRKRRRGDNEDRAEQTRTPERHVHMINGGFAGGGTSRSSRKRHLKEVYHVRENSPLPELPTI